MSHFLMTEGEIMEMGDAIPTLFTDCPCQAGSYRSDQMESSWI
jgi:hypothetical protein